MLKITKYSAIALASSVIIGCGGGGSDNGVTQKLQNNGKAATIEGLRTFGDKANTKNLSNTKIRTSVKSLENKQDDSDDESICQSGTLDFSTSKNQQAVSIDAKNCNDGYSAIDGSVYMEIYNNESGGFFEVRRDLTINDEYFSVFAKKGSFLKVNISPTNMTISTAFQTTINGEEFSASNLNISASMNGNNGSFSILSGQMIIGDYYFEVDTSRGPSSISTSEDGYVSGAIKLLDGAGHKVEISIVSADELAFKIDENGDGVFSENEILIENIPELFDSMDE